MDADLTRALAAFPDAVLTGVDADGWPVSVRCRPRYDGAALRCATTPGVTIADGPACVLCHDHDATLGRLRSFLVCGEVATDDAEWVLTSRRVVEGLGMSGPFGDARAFVAARRRAGRYLAARGLRRPRVPWERLRA